MNKLPSCFDGAVSINGAETIIEKIALGKPLRIKFGVDPTRPDLTLGHLVCLNFLSEMQKLGHQVVFIIGDFTTKLGDPTGRSKTRPMLSDEEIKKNISTYEEQVFRILDKEKTEIRYNSEWFGKMSFIDCLNLASRFTVNGMMKRDDFLNRLTENTPVSISEFLYPLLQGFDSIQVKADIEIGGNDQLFNMQVGRHMQEQEGMTAQTVVTLPLLVGLDGIHKMSKSHDNYIAFNDTPNNVFGKVMSISDKTMHEWFRVLFNRDSKVMLQNVHPMKLKKSLAHGIVKILYDRPTADTAQDHFVAVFENREVDKNIETFSWSTLTSNNEEETYNLILATKKIESKSQIRKLIESGAVRINGNKIPASYIMDAPQGPGSYIFKIGKLIQFKIVK